MAYSRFVWEVAAESETTATAAAVWALWADPNRWKAWNERIAWAELLGPLAVGTRARIRFKRSPRALTFTVTALEHERAFTDEVRLPGVRMGHEHTLTPVGSMTRIRHRLYFEGPAEKVYALLMGRQMRTAVRRFGELERSIAEGRISPAK